MKDVEEKLTSFQEVCKRVRYDAVRCAVVPRTHSAVTDALHDLLHCVHDIRSDVVGADEAPGMLVSALDRHLALQVLAEALHRDMAYRNEQMSANEALKLASRFFALFGQDAKFFSNGTENFIQHNRKDPKVVDQNIQYLPTITQATFSIGIFIIDTDYGAFILVEDED